MDTWQSKPLTQANTPPSKPEYKSYKSYMLDTVMLCSMQNLISLTLTVASAGFSYLNVWLHVCNHMDKRTLKEEKSGVLESSKSSAGSPIRTSSYLHPARQDIMHDICLIVSAMQVDCCTSGDG